MGTSQSQHDAQMYTPGVAGAKKSLNKDNFVCKQLNMGKKDNSVWNTLEIKNYKYNNKFIDINLNLIII